MGVTVSVKVVVILEDFGIAMVGVGWVIDFVDTTVLVEPGKRVKGIVIVLIRSKVWVVVSICGVFVVVDVNPELPSTGTIE